MDDDNHAADEGEEGSGRRAVAIRNHRVVVVGAAVSADTAVAVGTATADCLDQAFLMVTVAAEYSPAEPEGR